MFSNTAYEAFYQYLGLYLHSESISIITSDKVLATLVLMIFGGTLFFMFSHYVSAYVPGNLLRRSGIPLSSFAKLFLSLIVGISILQVDSTTGVKTYKNTSWNDNSYIQSRRPGQQPDYRVSFVFDILSRSSEEASKYLVEIIDRLFQRTNSETTAPSYFFKAIMYASADTIDDPTLRDRVRQYTTDCYQRVIPTISAEYGVASADNAFKNFPQVDNALKKIPLDESNPNGPNCFTLKTEVTSRLFQYSSGKVQWLSRDASLPGSPVNEFQTIRNLEASQALVNYYYDQQEDWLGMQKGTEAKGLAGKFFEVWHKLGFSWDGKLAALGLGDLQGASQYAERTSEFSELVQRAPHLAGMAKMLLIFVFPWLIFFLASGRWRVVAAWFAIYSSVLLWAPIWTLFYHIMTSLTLSAEMMSKFGELSDGISMYASQLITKRIYRFYSLYTWIQILTGPAPTAVLAYKLMPWILDKREEQDPNLLSPVKGAIKTAAS